ncbi:MAG TPA: DsbA family protein [Patescibacteria group bacterium]|nr:DsbA family protein [Patescibacteria group bacterium]
MATKKKETPASLSDDYIEVKLPHISTGSKTLLLTLLLIGIAFFAGYQTAKVTYWEQKEKVLSAAIANNQAAQPTPTPAFYKVGNGHLPIMGNPNAKVTLVEFSDLQCLFCRQFWKDTLPQLKKDYIDKGLVKLVYRQFPLPAELHPAARDLSEASECANDQGKFWDFEEKAFATQAAQGDGTIPISTDDINSWAQTIGLDMNKFSTCFTAKADAKKIDTDQAEGQQVNVNSTPTFFINGQIMVGALPYSSFKTVIDQQLKK